MSRINQTTIYRTSHGKEIDLNKLINQNELTLAVLNKKVNARGDLIGPGGTIIKKSEEITNSVVIPDQIRVKQPVEQPNNELPLEKTKSKSVKNSDSEGDA